MNDIVYKDGMEREAFTKMLPKDLNTKEKINEMLGM